MNRGLKIENLLQNFCELVKWYMQYAKLLSSRNDVILANFVFKRCDDILHLLLEETVASRSKRPASSIRVFGLAGEPSSSVPSKATNESCYYFWNLES